MTPKVMDLVLSMKMMGLMINMMNCTGVRRAWHQAQLEAGVARHSGGRVSPPELATENAE